ncbi:MAG: hypothetical protein QNJ55_36150 [Xenococcus sp. MO_188.B8]|nr:hypothetical protein [Xenococcus sp. MO_188.B8]
MAYYIPQPPFLIPISGILIGILFGAMFQTIITQKSSQWQEDPQKPDAYKLEDQNLIIAYQGLCLGTWIFLGGGLLLFGFSWITAFGFALILTIGTGGLFWKQMGEMFLEMKQNGVQILDLDSFN